MLLLLFISQTYAQKATITGTIINAEGAVPGATIILEGTKYATLTDFDGNFTLLDIPVGNYQLVCNYLGYKIKILPIIVTDAKPVIKLEKITIEPDENLLGAVEVQTSYKAGSDDKAINMTKTAQGVVSILSAESISKLPTKTTAEAVRRMPGTTVENDKGEGALVSLRGTPVNWTATFVNGDRLPTCDEENASRAFDFIVLPADFVDFIVVSRSVTPDQEADNIGGIINFLTRSSVEKKTFNVNIGGGYNSLANGPILNGTLTYGNISKNGKFSYVTDFSYYGRAYGAQAYRVVYGSNFNHSLASYELKNYNGFRSTYSGNAAFRWKPNENTTFAGRFFTGIYTDDKNQQKTRFNYNDGSGQRLRLQTIKGLLLRQLFCGDISTEIKINPKLTFSAKLATYHNSFRYGNIPFKGKDKRNGYFFVEFMSPLLYYLDVDSVNFDGSALSPDNQAPFVGKFIGADNPYGRGDDHNNIQPQPINPQKPNDFLAPQDFEFYRAWSELNTTKESDPLVARADLTYKVNNNLLFQFGLKGRHKQGERILSLYQWQQNIPLRSKPYLLPEFETANVDTRGGFMQQLGSNYEDRFYPFLTPNQLLNFVPQLGDTLLPYEMNPPNTEYRFWAGNKFSYTETVGGGYAMVDAKINRWNLVGGFRVEYTNLQMQSDTLLDTLLFDAATSAFYNPPEARFTKQEYVSFLPSLNANFMVNEKTNLRFAVSRTLHRPNFTETKPGAATYCIDDLDLTFGNAQLKPTISYNADISYEYYWGSKGLFTLGGYYKYVQNHIFAVTTSFVDNFGIVAKRFDNAGLSYVFGFEANFMKQFTKLPGMLNGFGVNANITYSVSRMQVPGRSAAQPMANQTPLLYNLAVFYEKKALQARLAFNYTGAFLRELNLATVKDLNGDLVYVHDDSDFDIFKGANYSLDFGASYTIKEKYTVYMELMNLLDWPDLTYRGRADRPIRTEYYRRRGQIGFKYEF